MLQEDLKKFLTDFRYQSQSGLGQRGLMAHHIEALTKELVPFIEKYASEYTKHWLQIMGK